MVKIAMYGKGGIGKSTMSSNITAALTDCGLKVLQIGCDPKHDSTRLLLNGEVRETILDYLKNTAVADRKIEDIVAEGYGGCLCAEAGGPEPGVGCAGRGIISSFELLKNLGIDSVKRDITLYDVLGDVVCGGFAVPLRNEYADTIFIVSSGEFMSIYAANNILRGICNYNPDRVGGIIFNSRGDPEEEERIRRFSEAVKIPVIASFERSELFMSAEEDGKTVVEKYPDSPITKKFIQLAEYIETGEKFHSRYLSEEDLEHAVLGRSFRKKKKQPHTSVEIKESPKKKYMSRNVQEDEPYGGCALSGAYTTCSSIKGLSVILHAPLSCAQFTVQTTTCSCGKYGGYHKPIEGYRESNVLCSEMKEEDMIFGGTEKLISKIEASISCGNRNIAVITSCPSGIIGDDVRNAVKKTEEKHPGCKLALIEADGCLNGDFMQGVIDAGIAVCEKFSEKCGKTDTVNLIGTKPLALNCVSAAEMITEFLNSVGIGVNCLFPGAGDIDSLKKISSAKMNLMVNPDVFTVQLCTYLKDKFGTDVSPIPVRPGICGTAAWMGRLAGFFSRTEEYNRFMADIKSEFEKQIAVYRQVLKGKRYCIISATRDIDWIAEAVEAAGMIGERTVVVDRTDFSNETDIIGKIPGMICVKDIDIAEERKIIEDLRPDLIISTAHMGMDIPNVSVPLVSHPNPFTGVAFVREIALLLHTYGKEGWRKDVI